MSDKNRFEIVFQVGAFLAVTLGLYLSSLYSYLLFHSLVEIITIAVGFALFMLTWNTREYLVNSYLRLLGIGYGSIALIDLIHTLAFKGMNVFPGYGLNLPAQLWIAARYLQAITLFAAPFLVGRSLNNRTVLAGYSAAIFAMMAVVFSGHFPDCYVEGKGLTAFKIFSEYVITAFLLSSLLLFSRKREHFDSKVFFLVAASILGTILSEISFTAFVDMYGFANMVGHLAKLAAFYLIYRAIFVTGLKEPFDLIFRDLKLAEESLRRSRETLEEKVRERTADLRESEERNRSLIHKVQAAIVLHDGQGQLVECNPLAEELLGLSRDQLSGKSLIDPEWHFLREDGSVCPVAEYPASQVIASRRPLRGHVAGINRPDSGTVVWVLVNAEPEFGEGGDLTRVIVSFVDITERKQAELALQRLNRELRAISDCNQLLMRAGDEQTLLDEVCRLICEEAGYRFAWVGYAEDDPDQSIRPMAWAGTEGSYLAEARLSWSADSERGRGPAGSAIRSGETVFVQDLAASAQFGLWREEALKHGYRSGLALPLKDEYGKAFGVLLLYSSEMDAISPGEVRLMEELAGDLAFGVRTLRLRAGREQAEAMRLTQERDYRTLAENSPDIIMRYDRDCRASYANGRVMEVLGRPPSSFLGSTPTEHFPDPPAEILTYQAILQQVIATGEAAEMEMNISSGSGKTEVHSIKFVAERDQEGRIIGALAMGRDVTEHRRLIEQLNQSQKMEAIGQLAGGVAHDFNNILTAIIGFSNLLKMKMSPADPQHFLIDQILAASDRAARVNRSLLAFSRKQVLLPKPVDVNAIILNVEKLLDRLIGEDIEFSVQVEGNGLIVMADEGQIEQVLMNLATNARDAMPGGGTLTITTEARALGEDFASAHGYGRAGTYAVITVADTGTGMDPQVRDRIFEPFFTTKEKGKGTGLGLSMAYGIIKQHEGFINVYSEPGKGATFRIYLPLVSTSVEQQEPETVAPPPRGTETLLLAEDNHEVRLLTTTILSDFGYRVIEAVDGKDALEKYMDSAKDIDLLILDVIMPKMSGKEVHDAVKAIRPDSKILFISGYTADALKKKGLFGEGVQFIAKPMSPFELLRKVRGILDGPPGHGAAETHGTL